MKWRYFNENISEFKRKAGIQLFLHFVTFQQSRKRDLKLNKALSYGRMAHLGFLGTDDSGMSIWVVKSPKRKQL